MPGQGQKAAPLIAVSTVGPNEYEVVEYCLHEASETRVYQTSLFPLAIDFFFEPCKLILMVTREASQSDNYHRISEQLGDRLETILIPTGQNDAELWDIFERVSQAVPQGSRVVFDVTHGFRSLPFVIFGVINYLRVTKGVSLERILYGAFDARQPGPNGLPRAPVFDLTLLVSLNDWLHAVEEFQVRSEGSKLAFLLDQAHRRGWLSGEDRDRAGWARLQSMARSIKTFSEAVRLLRPLDALEAAHDILRASDQVRDEVTRWAKPFGLVLSDLTDEIRPLAIPNASALDDEHLQRQLALIEYYLNKDLTVQAVLLGREWLINWVVWRTGQHSRWLDRNLREKVVAFRLNEKAKAAERNEQGEPCSARVSSSRSSNMGPEAQCQEDILDRLEALREKDEIVKLWMQLGQLRNDVAHCAMNDRPTEPESIRKRMSKIVAGMKKLLVPGAQGA
ncbi:MAG: TIGR02221 family CRISPR-associated protein [Firmicutes bacterium]|nr:TIGR02221 family CRISPR-associated protein [Candidatus Fermentithermobacillaceae bacterium]